jgi:hypothetical protein
MANDTKVVINGETSQAVSALHTLGDKLDNTTRKMFDMSSAAGTLAGAVTITAMAAFIKSNIDAADSLHQMSIRTGTAVEDLAGLKYAADQNDTSLQAVGAAAKKLSSSLVDQPELFASIGVTATDSTGALIQMADIFAVMPDGVEKNALAVKLLGKSGEEMIPMLNNGSAALRTMIEEGKALNPVTAESARQAADFNDNLDRLATTAGGFGMRLANDMLPQLTKITQAVADTARESGLLEAIWVGLGAAGTAIFTDDMLEREEQIRKRLKEISDLRSGGDALPGALRRADAESPQLEAELATLVAAKEKEKAILLERKQFREELAAMSGYGGMDIDPAQAKIYEMAKFGASDAEINAAQERVNRLLEVKKNAIGAPAATKQTVKQDPNQSGVDSLQSDQFRKQMESMGVASAQVKVYELAMHGATKAQIEQAQVAADSIMMSEAQIKSEKDKAKAIEEASKLTIKQGEEQRKVFAEMAIEQAALSDSQAQIQMANLQGDPRIEAERAIAIAQEQARFQIKADAMAAETQKMLNDGTLTEQIALDQYRRREMLEQQHQVNLSSIEQSYLTARQQFEKQATSQQIGTISSMLMQATAAGAARNKALFDINKAASIANAIVSTYEGANKALALGPWGIPVAAAIVAGGLANVATIAETKFGGGMPSGGGAGSGIPSLATSLPASSGSSVAVGDGLSQAQTKEPTVLIQFSMHALDPSSFTPEAQRKIVDGFTPMIQQAFNRNAQVATVMQ